MTLSDKLEMKLDELRALNYVLHSILEAIGRYDSMPPLGSTELENILAQVKEINARVLELRAEVDKLWDKENDTASEVVSDTPEVSL